MCPNQRYPIILRLLKIEAYDFQGIMLPTPWYLRMFGIFVIVHHDFQGIIYYTSINTLLLRKFEI